MSDWVLIPPSSKIIKKLFLMLKKFLCQLCSRYSPESKQGYSLFQSMDIPKYSTKKSFSELYNFLLHKQPLESEFIIFLNWLLPDELCRFLLQFSALLKWTAIPRSCLRAIRCTCIAPDLDHTHLRKRSISFHEKGSFSNARNKHCYEDTQLGTENLWYVPVHK